MTTRYFSVLLFECLCGWINRLGVEDRGVISGKMCCRAFFPYGNGNRCHQSTFWKYTGHRTRAPKWFVCPIWPLAILMHAYVVSGC